MSKTLEKESSVLEIYLKEINKYPLLNKEEEKGYAIKKDNGDESARKKLIESNLRFVVNVAKRYIGRGLSFEDLISEGNLGLMKAVEKYDYTRGYHLISYAVWWIRQGILKSIGEQSRTIRIPLNVHNQITKINKSIDEIFSENEIPTIKKISEMTKLPEKKVYSILRIQPSISLDDYCSYDSEETIGETIEDKKNPNIEENVLNSELRNLINENITSTLKLKKKDILNEKEKYVLTKRFGLDGNGEYTLDELGLEYDLTRERIRQIEEKALKKLRKNKSIKKLASYLE